MSNRDYVKTGKLISLPDSSIEKRKMNNDTWKGQVFFHFLNFYKSCNLGKIREIIEDEKNKPQARIEDEIALFIRNSLKHDRKFGLHGFSIAGGVNNDEAIKGLYDISIFHSDWRNAEGFPVEFHFECKNLDNSSDLVRKYIFHNTYKKDVNNENIFDGGVYRYFIGKYAQQLNFGGMIGFILEGDVLKIKKDIINKLTEKFNTTPDGDLLRVIDNSIENNNFTFDSHHLRFDSEFVLHHLLLNFS